MKLIKTGEALKLCDKDGWLLFGGKNTRKHPLKEPVKAKVVHTGHGRVEWTDESGKCFYINKTGTAVWAAPLGGQTQSAQPAGTGAQDDPDESHQSPEDLTAVPFGIELVVYRDPDGDTELSFYRDGKPISPSDLGITIFDVDPSRHAPEEEEEWREVTKKDIATASPAAGAHIRSLTGLDE